MKIQFKAPTLVLSDIHELTAANSTGFRDDVRAALKDEFQILDVDLSQTRLVDSSGLGALLSLHKTMCLSRGRGLRILNPTPTVLHILELTRLHRVFEIVTP